MIKSKTSGNVFVKPNCHKWIKCSDRMPDPEQEIKILGHNGEYAFECEFEDGHWCNIGGEELVYWMPLPELPKAT